MLKLFVYPADRSSRLRKFLIVTIFFFISVLFACPSGHAFDGPGLYKDGEKVIGFDLAPSDEADITLNATKTMAEEVDKKRRVLPENMADADSFSEQKNYIKTLLECKELVTTIKEKLEQGENIEEESDLLVNKGEDLVQVNLEIIRKFDEIERECQERGYSQTILDRHAQMVKEHKDGVRKLEQLLRNLDDQSGKEGLSEKIEKLHKFFSDKKFKEDPPLVNAQALPVNIMKMEAPVVQVLEQEAPVDIRRLDSTFEKEGPPAEVKTKKAPVTKEGIQTKGPENIDILAAHPTQDDLDPTIDVQFTQDITDLANSLNNSPLKIYEYVKNNFEFEPYLGSRKGSQETLNHRSGNDYDLSSLLIALFRVSNIPARYVTGIVEMTPDRAKNWLGVENAATAGGILTTAGMEGVNIMDGPEVVAIRCRRVWVEAYIPYTNYRGIGNDDTGKMWVPMDPAFKQYDYQAGIDIPEEMGFDAEAFIDDYISTFHEDSPVELYKQQIIDYLAVNYPDLTYEDILRTRNLRHEVLGIIPGSLPYKLVSRDGEYSEIASDKRYQIRFHIHGSGAIIDYTANLPEIAGKQVTISYIGATAADQQIIDDAGGIYGVSQPWLVNLKPVLKVDGCDVAIGSGQVTMGIRQDSDMYFTPPTGAQNVVPAVYNEIIAGTYQGIGIDTWNVVTNFFAPMSTSCEESYTGYLLHDTAMKYLGRVDASNNEVGKTMQIMVMNDVAEAIVEHVVDVSYDLWGAPLTFEWSGLIVDADRSITGSFSVTGDNETCEFMRLTGADGSNLENRIFEDGFDEPAVSTIKILELASDMSIPIYEFDGTPCSTIYSSLNQPSYVEDAICAAVADGHVVTIPRDPITYYDWTGTGWIDMQANCAAGYIISGGRSGGATVKTWNIPIAGMECIKAEDITISPSAPNDIYCGGDTNYLVFTVKITAYAKDGDGNCYVMSGYPKNETFSTAGGSGSPMTIKDIADKYGGGVYTFYAGSPGGCGGCGSASKEFTIVKVEITDADVTQDNIHVNLTPSGLSGTLKLELTGPGSSHTIREVTRSSGNYGETFDIPNLATGEYTEVKAIWTVGGSSCFNEYSYHIRVLGIYRHSQYNIPAESQCAGGPTSAYVTDSDCNFTSTSFRSQFFSQVNLNGSGISINHGNIGREFFCLTDPNAPADASGRSFRAGVTFNGACFSGTGSLNNTTVAVLPDHPYLNCGERIYIHNVGTKNITDFCPGCATNQLDNFSTDKACSGINDIGNFMTIKLF